MRLTTAKIDRIRKAVAVVQDCDELQQSYQQSPLAHEARAHLYDALRACSELDQLRRNGVRLP